MKRDFFFYIVTVVPILKGKNEDHGAFEVLPLTPTPGLLWPHPLQVSQGVHGWDVSAYLQLETSWSNHQKSCSQQCLAHSRVREIKICSRNQNCWANQTLAQQNATVTVWVWRWVRFLICNINIVILAKQDWLQIKWHHLCGRSHLPATTQPWLLSFPLLSRDLKTLPISEEGVSLILTIIPVISASTIDCVF